MFGSRDWERKQEKTRTEMERKKMYTSDCDDCEGAEIEERVAFQLWPLKLLRLRVSGLCEVVRAFSSREKPSVTVRQGTTHQLNQRLRPHDASLYICNFEP